MDAPRTMIPNFAEVLYRMITKYPNLAREHLQLFFLDPAVGFPGPFTMEDRKSVLRLLLSTRQLKRFKDVIRELNIKAHGLQI
jgi:hypothetical protein